MGTFTYCDRDDCRNTENDCKIHDMQWKKNNEVHKLLGMSLYDHICQECIDEINSEYADDNQLLIFDNETVEYLIPNPNHKKE